MNFLCRLLFGCERHPYACTFSRIYSHISGQRYTSAENKFQWTACTPHGKETTGRKAMDFSYLDLGLIFLVTFLGATLQGAVGYGMALMAGPILLLINPELIPGPMTVAASLLVVLMIIRDKQALDFFGLRWAVLGMVFGVALGAYTLANFSAGSYYTVFSILIILAVLLSVAGLRFPLRKSTLTGAGFLAGLMSILTTTSGPPIALLYQDAPGKKLRATISGFFIVGNIFTVSALISIGKLGLHELNLSLFLMPGILMGYLLSSRIVRWVDQGFTRPFVLGIATISALMILISNMS